ncbi:MAG: hypothetical protein ACLQF1_18070 [Methyloceanibacter sp.]
MKSEHVVAVPSEAEEDAKRPRREKVFGDGRPRPLDRNAKARIMTLARALMAQ